MTSAFQPYDPNRELQLSRRNLPHWQQRGATYFVTFRLADSLPASVRERFEEMRRLGEADAFAWVDRHLAAGSGGCPLRLPEPAMTVASTLRHFDGKHYALGAFVVMPNHAHVLVQPLAPATLTSVVHSWKSYSAHELQRQAGIRGRVWQEESFDRIVRSETELRKFHDYIVANPSAASLPAGNFLLGQGSANWLDRKS
ncbi:MAG: transposase [Opitutae bacterium]|nr:transposase [Opitutae bacterium]